MSYLAAKARYEALSIDVEAGHGQAEDRPAVPALLAG